MNLEAAVFSKITVTNYHFLVSPQYGTHCPLFMGVLWTFGP